MDLETLRQLCLSFPGVTEDIKWGADLCFNIGAKMFVVCGPDSTPVSASFKCSDEDFESLITRPGFIPAPYLARHKWVHIDDLALLTPAEWQRLAHQAYTLVRSKLPKKIQDSLPKGL